MKKSHVWGLVALVWAGGFGVSGAFAYVMTRPLVPIAPETSVTEVTFAPVAKTERVANAVDRAGSVTVLPEVSIVGHVPVAAPPAKPSPPRDISQMSCGAWRDLEQGSNSVRTCD